MGFWLHERSLFLLIVTILFVILAILVLNFFRDPERAAPTEPNAIISPADGLIVQLAEEEFENRPVRRLSIFMSPLDVHVNRTPIAGRITPNPGGVGPMTIAMLLQNTIQAAEPASV